MSGSDSTSEKTEQPTPRRLREARRRGQVGMSRELSASLSMVAVIAILSAFAGWAAVRIAQFYLAVERILSAVSKESAIALLFEALSLLVVLSSGPLLLAAAVSLGVSWLQIGSIFAAEAITPKLERINPAAGLKRLLSLRTFVQFAMTLAKLLVISCAFVLVAWKVLPDAIEVIYAGTGAALALMRRTLWLTTLWCGGLFVALGLVDLLYQRHQWMRDLKMARHEVRREHREDEGDPMLRSLRRSMAAEPLPSELLGYVSQASIVLAEPGGRAVALIDRPDLWPTPLVVMRGSEEVARQMLERARHSFVPVHVDPVLVEAVYPKAIPSVPLPQDIAETVRPHLSRRA